MLKHQPLISPIFPTFSGGCCVRGCSRVKKVEGVPPFAALGKQKKRLGLETKATLVWHGGIIQSLDLDGGNSNIAYFHPNPWGNDPILSNIAQMGDSTTKQKATLVWNGEDYTSLDGMMRKLIETQKISSRYRGSRWFVMIFHNETMKAAFMGSFEFKRRVVKKYGFKHRNTLNLPPQPYPRTFTTRRIIDFSRGIPNYINLYLPLDVTGCGVRSK